MSARDPGVPRVAAMVLGGGASARMGRPKLALSLRGEPILRRVVRAALASRCREVVVVLGADAAIYRPLLDGLDVTIALNPHPEEGIGSSIRTGIQALPASAGGVVILLGDQPMVTAPIIDGLIDAAAARGCSVVASSYAGVVGPPAYFDRVLFSHLLALRGDRGARAVIEAHMTTTAVLPLPDASAADIDTAEDLDALDGPSAGEHAPAS